MAACLWEYLSLNMCMKQPWDIEKAAFKSYKSNTEAAICSAIRASFFFLREPAYCNDIKNDAGRYLKQQTTSLRKVLIKGKKVKLEVLEISYAINL